jgi:hypothetical protein
MTRKLLPLLAVVLGLVSLPALVARAAPATGLAKTMQQVDADLDRALRNLNAAEELVNKKHLAATDQPMVHVRGAEEKIGQAVNMFRTVEATKPTKTQIEQVQRALTEARGQLREAGSLIDRSGQKSKDHKLLRGLVSGADHRVDLAMKMLRQMAASAP